MVEHRVKFDQLCHNAAAVGDAMDKDEKLATLLRSLSSDYDATVEIIENNQSIE